MTDYRALAQEIAADLTPMYVPDGTSGRFERVDMAHVLEHVLIVIERHQPQGAVDAWIGEIVRQECYGKPLHGIDAHGLALRVGRRVLERFDTTGGQ
jgi:hypothetical protein